MFVSPRALLSFVFLIGVALIAPRAAGEPLSKKTEIDFYRDVPSRNLKGLAARSDGRLVAGPTLTELNGSAPADLFWCLAPTRDAARWLVGSGPDGKIFEVTINDTKGSFATRELAKLDESHVFALAQLADGSILAGTSPRGALCLIRDGKVVARTALPVDSIFDILTPASGQPNGAVLVATGNPGRVYQVDVAKFAKAGVTADKLTDQKILGQHGIAVFGDIRDRNVRRLARLPDGRVVAGSAPKGNIYAFSATGGAPVILQENRESEVTDLLPSADGGFFATLTLSSSSGESRMIPAKGAKETAEVLSSGAFTTEKFSGRSNLLWFPPNGFPEVLTSRSSTAFYRMGRRGDLVVIAGGEQGEILGFDIRQRLSLTFAGSVSSQLSGMMPVADADGKFLILRNNAPGFAILDFGGARSREAETRRIDLGAPSHIGALRFNRLRDVNDAQLTVEAKTSNGSDEIEGWGPWTALKAKDGGWGVDELRGRYLKLRVKLPADSSATTQLDKASLFALPQNRRPQLQEFHLLTPNFGLIVAPTPVASPTVSVGQLLQSTSKEEEAKAKSSFLGSQIVPAPGAQVALWTLSDPDGDALLATFSLRRDGDENWIELARNTSAPYVQFDTAQLPDGIYFTRLVATETEPRRAADRLSTTFETDDLVIDHTAPEILQASAKRDGDKLIISVHGRDALSILDGVEVVFNNAFHAQTEQPDDGIRDSREETFTLEFPVSRIADATNVEVSLYDAVGNATTKRLTW